MKKKKGIRREEGEREKEIQNGNGIDRKR